MTTTVIPENDDDHGGDEHLLIEPVTRDRRPAGAYRVTRTATDQQIQIRPGAHDKASGQAAYRVAPIEGHFPGSPGPADYQVTGLGRNGALAAVARAYMMIPLGPLSPRVQIIRLG